MTNNLYSLNDCIYLCLKDGRYYTFWEIQAIIHDKTGKFYGEPTISAGIRNMRKDHCRERYGLKKTGGGGGKKGRETGRGYKYKLITNKE